MAAPGEVVRRGAIGVVAPPPGHSAWGEIFFVDGGFEALEVATDKDGVARVASYSARGNGREDGGRGGLGAAAFEATESGAAASSMPPSPEPTTIVAAPPTPAPTAAPTRTPSPTPTPAIYPKSAECTTGSYSLYSWRKPTYSWSFQMSTTPLYLANRINGTSIVAAALKRANTNIVTGRNVCGRADAISASFTYLGNTGRAPNISSSATCSGGNGYSSLGFGALPYRVAAMACAYRILNGVAAEGDVKLATGVRWATSVASCSDAYLIEAVMTHEFGHIYGLRHVTSSAMTMYPSVAKCRGSASTLGLGDMRGLERKY